MDKKTKGSEVFKELVEDLVRGKLSVEQDSFACFTPKQSKDRGQNCDKIVGNPYDGGRHSRLKAPAIKSV
ncbi:hypothetical protein AKJ65_05715 [candidate division MSBL1 archaeon SCGC-AAA259E19]|uniref:Uncharacterized protein n=1 Tax=candidate division MSBL1 archaeon SCGC-AAA259E19 TaxID=1698264 RepID=A0A133UIG0_9EURY|nr:hypothetical protein AKJ65_05715 [candidate division MSBL1 archaeon SCGC-AAA259E19]